MLDPEVNDWQTRRYEDDGVTNKYKCRIWVPTVSTQDFYSFLLIIWGGLSGDYLSYSYM